MKIGRKPGVTRRPLEYALMTIVLVLIGVLVWSNYSLKQTSQEGPIRDVKGIATFDRIRQIGTVTEADAIGEYRFAGKLIKHQRSLFDDSNTALEQMSKEYDKYLSGLNSCTTYADSLDSSLNNINNKINNFYEELDDDIDDIDENRNKYDRELTAWRIGQDTNRLQSYGANNQESKSNYYVLDGLVLDRRHRFDTATQNYRQSTDKILADRSVIIRFDVEKFSIDLKKISASTLSYCHQLEKTDPGASNLDTALINNSVILGQDLHALLTKLDEYKQNISVESAQYKSLVKDILSEFEYQYYQNQFPKKD